MSEDTDMSMFESYHKFTQDMIINALIESGKWCSSAELYRRIFAANGEIVSSEMFPTIANLVDMLLEMVDEEILDQNDNNEYFIKSHVKKNALDMQIEILKVLNEIKEIMKEIVIIAKRYDDYCEKTDG